MGFEGWRPRIVLCDIDGVVVSGRSAIPGSPEAVRRLAEHGIEVIYCTNNSTRTPADVVEMLRGADVECGIDRIVTSAIVAGRRLRELVPVGVDVLVVGETGIRTALEAEGFRVLGSADVDPSRDAAPAAVVVGLDRSADYQSVRAASWAVREGARFVATNSDALFPVDGQLWPAAGAMLAAIQVAGGRDAEVVGKPSPVMYRLACGDRVDGDELLVVGDSVATDIAGGAALGARTALITGGGTADTERSASTGVEPDHTFESLAALVDDLIGARA